MITLQSNRGNTQRATPIARPATTPSNARAQIARRQVARRQIVRRTSCYQQGGFTLAEAAVSTVIVGVMLVAVMNTVGAARFGEYKLANENQGLMLAKDLMAEILQQNYADPVLGRDSFGISSIAAATGDRSLFDDVDDYDGWSASPPERKDGTPISAMTDWKRGVEVHWVNPNDLSQDVSNNQSVKRITVTVMYKNVSLAKLIAYRGDV